MGSYSKRKLTSNKLAVDAYLMGGRVGYSSKGGGR